MFLALRQNQLGRAAGDFLNDSGNLKRTLAGWKSGCKSPALFNLFGFIFKLRLQNLTFAVQNFLLHG